jgi:hypothetical protein
VVSASNCSLVFFFGGWDGKLGTASLIKVLAYNVLAKRIKDFETVETGARTVSQLAAQWI